MREPNHNCEQRRRPCLAAISTALGLVLVLVLGFLSATPARASFEQVGHFADSGEGMQLLSVAALAVNTTGAGGVPPGTVYAATALSSVARYDPDGSFSEAWGWRVSAGGSNQFERCGPGGEPAHPHCSYVITGQEAGGFPGEGAGQLSNLQGIAVDQQTGYVYVRSSARATARRHNLIQVFSADGSQLIDSFGDSGVDEAVSESPEKLHSEGVGSLAVDDSGTVYAYDIGKEACSECRVMVFKPQSPGDYENYVYTGRANDLAVTKPGANYSPVHLAVDSAGNLYTANETDIYKFDPSGPETPICHYHFATGGINTFTVDPGAGGLFFFTYKTKNIRQLSPCNSEGEFTQTGEISITPKSAGNVALAYNPNLAVSAGRSLGVLYAADPNVLLGSVPSQNIQGIGDIFAPSEAHPPSVESESFGDVTASSALLKATIDPRGFPTRYRFQYLSEAAYEANEPSERQSLTVGAAGGVFGLGFEGRELGGTATANLVAGSTAATSLTTAKGHANVDAANGTATLTGADGSGTVISGSSKVTAVSTSAGAFAAGQTINGQGITSGTTIMAVTGTELTLSAPASASAANISLKAGTSTLTSLSTSEGTFEAGEAITGNGIAPGTTITAATPTQLTLSKPVEGAGAVAISAGSRTLTGAVATAGKFELGAPIAGEGIPAETTITAVEAGSLQISKAPTKPGSAVAITSAGPTPLAAGETVEGPGIAPGTTIVAAKAGELTLSAPAETTVPNAPLRAGLPWDATGREVRRALEALPSVGAANVSVSGGPGDEAGSSPYQVEFTGALGNQDLPELEPYSSGLTGGSATAAVAVLNDGGEGFADGASEAPAGGGLIEGSGPTIATAGISNLAPGTRYRFRALATSECEGVGLPLCEDAGMPASFVTFPAASSNLPDDRKYELVTPRLKEGGEVFPLNPQVGTCLTASECKPGVGAQYFPKLSAPDGEALVYQGQPFSQTEGATVYNEYLSKRTADGWRTTTLAPRLMGSSDQGYKGFNPELSQGVLLQLAPSLTPDAPSKSPNLYTQPGASPAELTPLIRETPPNHTEGGLKIAFAGSSKDFSQLFFAANDALTGPTNVAPEALYEGANKSNLYESAGGVLRLVNVLPGNAEAGPGAHFGAAPVVGSTGTGSADTVSDLSHAISDDGSRVFWSDEAGQVYVRENGETTVQIDDPGKFLTAAADGSKVLLRDGCLYSLASGECEDLSENESGIPQGGFLGIAGASEDLSRIYFVDSEALAGENAEGKLPNEGGSGEPNLYLWNEGTTSFIATLLAGGQGDNRGVQLGQGGADWTFTPSQRTAQASPDGRWLAFLSRAPLTGYDNFGPACEVGSANQLLAARCNEVFLFEAEADGGGKLVCASCNPSGGAPAGFSVLPLAVQSGGNEDPLEQPRYLTNQGRLYFNSQDRLTQLDTNGRAEDVYQFEPEGIGSCHRAGGCVDLISAGTGADDSNFLAVDSSGGNVFFTTRDQLVLNDKDELLDVYDAREGGGLPGDNEAGSVECQAEACQAPPSPPAVVTPGSSSVESAGNVKQKKPAKKHKKKHKKKHTKKNKNTKKHSRGGAR